MNVTHCCTELAASKVSTVAGLVHSVVMPKQMQKAMLGILDHVFVQTQVKVDELQTSLEYVQSGSSLIKSPHTFRMTEGEISL